MSVNPLYPKITKELLQEKKSLSPKNMNAWSKFSEVTFEEGALSVKTKEFIAIASGHITQCPYCIKAHTNRALKNGASKEEIMEAIWVATEIRAGASFAHSSIAVETMNKFDKKNK